MLKNQLSFIAILIGLQFTFAQTTTVELIPQGSSWKYLDNGSNQGTAWRAITFDDAAWKSGLAELGYGDGDESTIVSFGSSSSKKFITTYFRRSISINNLSELSNFVLNVRRDDGIVLYINGTERYRNNMPTGTITHTTLAAADASDDGKTWFSANLSASHFVNGTNVIAVEIHQRSASSSDISFDLRLTATQTQVDTQPPLLAALSPADNASNVAYNTNLVLTFNENVTKGSGSFTIKENGVVKQTIAVTSSNVVVNANTVTILPSAFTFGTNVNIEFPSGVIKDLAGFNFAGMTVSTDWNFGIQAQPAVCNSIGCFTSVQPGSQGSTLVLPSTHTFQMLFKQGNSYTSGGTAPTGFDFTGYVPKSGSSANGYVAINHENSPGGVSVLDVSYNSGNKLWTRNNAYPVSFSTVVKTERNCSGTVTPWGTVITAEETTSSGDANSDGYQDVGWLVEIDPVTRKLLQYGTGKDQKLWAMGRMSHENVVIANDNKTAYYGEDATNGALYKFVATNPQNLYSGTLYTLKLSSALSGGEPTSSTGTWVQVPNTTQNDRNNTFSLATSLGATPFNGIEDVEIGPDNKVYFTSKGHGRVYRFTDNGTSVSNFETYVGGRSYTINFGSGSASTSWGTGNDNLAFDGEGNLWVNQDGGNGHLWVVRAGHTQASPKVELFAKTPAGSESTGLTFTPDFKFMFVSFQHPNSTNTSQVDATGTSVAINAASMVVIARKEFLGSSGAREEVVDSDLSNDIEDELVLFPIPFENELCLKTNLSDEQSMVVQLLDENGKYLGTLLQGKQPKGESIVQMDVRNLSTTGFLYVTLGEKTKLFRLVPKR